MTLQGLAGRTVLLTGVTGDIGATYLSRFTAAGANVIAGDLPSSKDEGERLAEEATASGPGSAVFVACDITDEAAELLDGGRVGARAEGERGRDLAGHQGRRSATRGER